MHEDQENEAIVLLAQSLAASFLFCRLLFFRHFDVHTHTRHAHSCAKNTRYLLLLSWALLPLLLLVALAFAGLFALCNLACA